MSHHLPSMKKHSRIILVCLVIGLMIGGAVAKLQPPAYVVSSTLIITSIPTYGGGTNNTPSGSVPAKTTLDISISDAGEILTRAVMNYVYNSYPQLKARGLKPDELLQIVTDTNPTPTAATILLTTTAPRPETALMIVNDVANGYVAYKTKRIQDEVDQARAHYQDLYNQYQAQSTQLEHQILTYNNATDPHIALLTAQRNSVIQTMTGVQAQLAQLPTSVHANVSVIEPAKIKDVVLSTRPILYFSLIAASGLLIGLLVWLLMIYLDYRIQTDDQVPEKLGLNYLGTLSKDKELQPGSIPTTGLAAQQLANIAANLRLTGILPSPQHTSQGGAVLLITSIHPKDGKTTIATGLAAAAARVGRSVLVIDGNLREPSTHLAFSLAANGFGLSGLLKGTGRENLDAAVQPTSIPGVWFLAGGAAVAEPNSLLEQRMPAILAQLRKKTDWIIIDGPPLLEGAEAGILAAMADGAAVVSGREKVRLLMHAKAILSSLAHTPSGMIMNRLSQPKHNPYYAATYSEDSITEGKLAGQAHAKNGNRRDVTAGQLASHR